VVLVVLLLANSSCVSNGPCERSAYWESKLEPELAYAIALQEAFEFDENNQPTERELLAHRVMYLEKLCFQTRIQ
jgi:hypothetical protein